jgi:hypothetical protein
MNGKINKSIFYLFLFSGCLLLNSCSTIFATKVNNHYPNLSGAFPFIFQSVDRTTDKEQKRWVLGDFLPTLIWIEYTPSKVKIAEEIKYNNKVYFGYLDHSSEHNNISTDIQILRLPFFGVSLFGREVEKNGKYELFNPRLVVRQSILFVITYRVIRDMEGVPYYMDDKGNFVTPTPTPTPTL